MYTEALQELNDAAEQALHREQVVAVLLLEEAEARRAAGWRDWNQYFRVHAGAHQLTHRCMHPSECPWGFYLWFSCCGPCRLPPEPWS